MNYKESGVDIEKTDNLVKEISGLVDNIGGFGGLFDLGDSYLVGATDGVGTKILLAQEYNMLYANLRWLIHVYHSYQNPR